jgi:hypothetical protein
MREDRVCERLESWTKRVGHKEGLDDEGSGRRGRAEKDHVRGPSRASTAPSPLPRPSLAIPMVASHPLDFPFPFSILLCPCLKGPHLPRAGQRPEVCPVNLPFQDHSDPLHSSSSDQCRFRVVIIAIAVG